MALSSATVWECRTTGNDLNGGGFVAGASGVDYSQQDAAQVTINDASCSGTTTLRTSSGGFAVTLVGNVAQISGGTLTAGFYQVVGVANSNTLTLDRSAGSGSSSTVKFGGALASLGVLSGAMVASNKAFVKASTFSYSATTTITFSASVSPSASNSPSRLIGYGTTRGDSGRFPLGLATSSSVEGGGPPITALNFSGSGWIVEGATVDCGSVGNSTGINLSGTASDCRRCKVMNFTTCGINAAASDTAVSDCEVSGGGSGSTGIIAAAANVKILRSYIHDNAGVGIAATTDDLIAWNIVANNAGSTLPGAGRPGAPAGGRFRLGPARPLRSARSSGASGLGVVQIPAVDLHPRLDVVGRPHLALGQVGDRLREVGTTGDLVRTLPTDATEANADLVCAHEPDRFHCHMIDRRRETISR